MNDDITVLWAAQAELGEGTCWSVREQALYWVDILGRRLYRWRARDGARAQWDFEQTVSAVAERLDGAGLVLALREGVALFDPERPAAPQWLHRPAQEPAGNRFNDGKCDAEGRFWAGSMDFDCRAPTGALYAFDAQGGCTRHALGFAVTNGPAWSLDGRTIWVNDTVQGTVHAWDVDMARGTLARGRPWLQFAPGDGLPDGMTVDAEGRLWICHWGGACITAHDPHSGRELARLRLPASQITNCAFGGSDLRTLFVTSARVGLDARQLQAEPLAGAVFALRMATPGLPAARFG